MALASRPPRPCRATLATVTGRAEGLLLHRGGVLGHVDQDGRLHVALPDRLGDRRAARDLRAPGRRRCGDLITPSCPGIVIGPILPVSVGLDLAGLLQQRARRTRRRRARARRPARRRCRSGRRWSRRPTGRPRQPRRRRRPRRRGTRPCRRPRSAPGVRVSAQAAITFLPVAVGAGEGELVHARAAQRGAGLAEAGDDLEHRVLRHDLGEGVGQPAPTPGVSSLGLKTTALPAASA